MNIIRVLAVLLSYPIYMIAGSATATYTAGSIPTTFITSASVSTSSRAIDPGLLTVTIPSGCAITSVSVVYNMTATNGAYMSEQRSFLICTSAGGTNESSVYSGVGNSTATYSYSRTNLTIANNVIGGGDIQFALHAFRTYFGSGSNTTYNYVANNSWQVTVNYDLPIELPTNLTITPYRNQAILNWTKNAAGNNVMVAYNTTNTFGIPSNGTSYSVGGSISGGGTIIYNGSSNSFTQSSLNEGTQYYYKIWSVNGTNYYSTGVEGNATTNSSPIVSNVTFTNDILTTGFVEIYFDVTDAEQSSVTIAMEVSNNGGATYDFACTQVTGDIGSGISIGSSKHITWNFEREHSGVTGSNFKIRIIADDLVLDQIYYAGKVYNSVIIGAQTWLKENLDIGTIIQGTSNPSNNGTIEKYCFDNSSTNCDTYGGLYQWPEAMQYSTIAGAVGICPSGWHIPTYDQAYTLLSTTGNTYNSLVSAGFSPLVGGYRRLDGTFLGGYAGLWSSTESNSSIASGFTFDYTDYPISMLPYDKHWGYSIRCIKD